VGWWTTPLAPDPFCERVLAVVGVGCWACPPVPDPVVVACTLLALLSSSSSSFLLVGACPVVRGPRCGQAPIIHPTSSCSSACVRVPCRPHQRGDGVRSVHPRSPSSRSWAWCRCFCAVYRCCHAPLVCCQCDVAGVEGSGTHLSGTPLHRPPAPPWCCFREFIIYPVIHSASRGSQQRCRGGDSGWAWGMLLGVIVLFLV
jgi:hypothetical protein